MGVFDILFSRVFSIFLKSSVKRGNPSLKKNIYIYTHFLFLEKRISSI